MLCKIALTVAIVVFGILIIWTSPLLPTTREFRDLGWTLMGYAALGAIPAAVAFGVTAIWSERY